GSAATPRGPRPCPACGRGPLIQEQRLAAAGLPADTVLYRPRGCASCSRTGYSGRMAVYESFLVNDDIRTAAASGSAAEITAAVRRAGMHSLRDNALQLCFAGMTTLDEVNRVCGGGAAPRWAGALGGRPAPRRRPGGRRPAALRSTTRRARA